MLSVLSEEKVETVHSFLNSEEGVDSLLNPNKLQRASIALKVAIENNQKSNPDQHFVHRYTSASLQWLERTDAMSREHVADTTTYSKNLTSNRCMFTLLGSLSCQSESRQKNQASGGSIVLSLLLGHLLHGDKPLV